MKRPIVILSGGFDPIHEGHVAMIKDASAIGDVLVILNSDRWLKEKKGAYFMDLLQRAAVVGNMRGVEYVWHTQTRDSVAADLEKIKADDEFSGRTIIFGNGGDRVHANMPVEELEVCDKLGIFTIFGLGANNGQSSSKLLNRWVEISKV